MLVLLTGCVERRISITSDPPGSQVWLDGKHIGTTPVTIPFSFYGTRELTLYRKGYQTYSVMQHIDSPFYQYFPIDFISEFLWPFHLQNWHRFFYILKPYPTLNRKEKNQLIQRANKLKNESEQEMQFTEHQSRKKES